MPSELFYAKTGFLPATDLFIMKSRLARCRLWRLSGTSVVRQKTEGFISFFFFFKEKGKEEGEREIGRGTSM